MTENGSQWERELVNKLATAALKEQRRARLWGIFFKLLTFAYVTVFLLMAIDWKGGDVGGGKKHTAMVEVSGLIAPGTDASAEKITTALQAAFKDKNTQGVIVRINSPGGVLMIGDTSHDMEMARAAGVDGLAVTYGAHPEESLRACEPLGCFSSVTQLEEWLRANA